MFKVIIAGSRSFNDYDFLRKKLDTILININEEIEIVCGEAYGADELGKRYAIENKFKIKSMPANWNEFGKAADYIRNEEMAKYADACVCFWDGKSKGTKHMIDLAINYNIKLRIIKF